MNAPFFTWSSVTDQSYDRSYETAAFIDRAARFAGKTQLPFAWIRAAIETESQAVTWLRVVSGSTGSAVDVEPFEMLYLRAALDTFFPGHPPDGALKPEMFATVKIFVDAAEERWPATIAVSTTSRSRAESPPASLQRRMTSERSPWMEAPGALAFQSACVWTWVAPPKAGRPIPSRRNLRGTGRRRSMLEATSR